MPIVALLLAGALAATPAEREGLDRYNAIRGQIHLPPIGLEDYRYLVRREQEREAADRAKREKDVGFAPIVEAASGGKQVRRAIYRDPYAALRTPGVAVTRAANGEVSVRISMDEGDRVFESAVPAGAWERLAALEKAAFAPPPPPPFDPTIDYSHPPPVCHAWIVWLEAGSAGSARSAMTPSCHGVDAVGAYSLELARIAVEALPGCQAEAQPGQDARFILQRCFARLDPHTRPKP
jgi:hypothetical protein